MPLSSKKQDSNKPDLFTQRETLFSIIEALVYFFRRYLRYRVWALLLPLLIIMLMGKLFATEGMVIASTFLLYFLLSHLDKWFENHHER
jgi:hypothetical protein